MKDIPNRTKRDYNNNNKYEDRRKYKDDAEWKAKGIPESDIRKDVR